MGRSLSPSRRERFFFVAAGLVLAAATILRLWRLDHFSYWLDEILEARFVRGSWPDFGLPPRRSSWRTSTRSSA